LELLMRVLALLFVLLGLGLPALAAADYTPWPDRDEPLSVSDQLAQAQPQGQGKPGQAPGQGQNQGGGGKPTPSLSGGDYPGRYCCVHCRHNEVPCGGECVTKTKLLMCKKPAGCACSGKP
jgi:hypothetical protein